MTTEYKRGAMGHVLHYLREWGVSEAITEYIGTVAGKLENKGPYEGKNFVVYDTKMLAEYMYFDGIEQPLFHWHVDADTYNAQPMERQPDGSLKPKFRLSLDPITYMGDIRYPVLLFRGKDATPELREFLLRTMDADAGAARDVCLRASAFWKLCDDGNGFYVEIDDPKGAQAFVDYVNQNYVPPTPAQ
jgi:hypothetical protein